MSEDAEEEAAFIFVKGAENVVGPKEGAPFEWQSAAFNVRTHLSEALNARHVAFLLGSGCSSLTKDGKEVGIPTMARLAEMFIGNIVPGPSDEFVTETERQTLGNLLGLDIASAEYRENLERLMELLFSVNFLLERTKNPALKSATSTVQSVITKITRHIITCCTDGHFAKGEDSVLHLYQAFYRKLLYRDRALPRPWVFTTNYDIFNETALDRLGTAYCNGFSGAVERRFNPATYRYALAEQLDVSTRKWSSVDSYVYLCKLHGSINWIEEGKGLFPIREIQNPSKDTSSRVMVYPTPTKQNVSFGSPYSDLFREFQSRIVREQSILVVIGYGFGDEHINNIIFQALTVPTFRLIAFVNPEAPGVPARLRALGDPRIWIIGGAGPTAATKAHYFNTFIESFMPELPGEKVDTAIERVLTQLLRQPTASTEGDTES